MLGKPSKCDGVMRILRNRLMRGAYEGKLPSVRALAVELGTNPNTVQIALAQLEALQMVRRVPRQGTFAVPLGRSPNSPGLVYARLVFPVRSPPPGYPHEFWASEIIFAFEEAARQKDLTVALEFTEDVDHAVENAVAEARCPGCVGTCLLSMPLQPRHLVQLSAAGNSLVVADWDVEELVTPLVNFDNHEVGRLAASHLVQLGHRRIAFTGFQSGAPNQAKRVKGAEDLLRRVGLTLSHRLFCKRTPSEIIPALVSGPSPPTAVICDYGAGEAEGIIKGLERAGKHVPENLSMVAIMSERPPTSKRSLTGVILDHEAMGRRALEMLLSDSLDESPERVLIPPTLSEPHTSAPPPKPEDRETKAQGPRPKA